MANVNLSGRKRSIAHRAAALLVSITAVACGGGGGGGGGRASLSAPSNPIVITEANAAAIASAAVGAAGGELATEATGPMPIGAVVETDASATQRVVARVASQTLRRVVSANSAQSVTGVVQTEPCYVSGSFTVSGSETSASVTFDQCSDVVGEVMNGTMQLTGFSETGDVYTGSASATVWMDLSMTQSGATTRIIADYSMQLSWTPTTETLHLYGASLGYTDGVVTEVLANFDVSETLDSSTLLASTSSDFTFRSTVLGGAVTVDTQEAILGYTDQLHPYAGVIVVSGAGGSKARITISGDETDPAPQVQIELDLDGNGTYEIVGDFSWAELDAS